jgi:hypothetical protein
VKDERDGVVHKARSLVGGALGMATVVLGATAPAGAVPPEGGGSGSPRAVPVDRRWSARPDVSAAGVDALARTHDLTRGQARLLARRHELARRWLAEQERDPDFLSASAGAWLDPDRGLTVFIATTSSQVKAMLEAQGLPNWIVIELVTHSMDELAALATDVERTAVPEGEALTSRIDVTTNSVVVDLPEDQPVVASRAVEATRRLDPSRRAKVRTKRVTSTARVARPNACTGILHCDAPLRGGIALTPSWRTTPACTLGFIYHQPGTNRRFASTAAHCGPGQWTHRGITIGSTAVLRNEGSTDYQLIAIDNNDLWKSTNAVWKPHSEQFRITRVADPRTSVVGAPACHTGYGLVSNGLRAESCGTLVSPSVSAGGWQNMGEVRGAWSCSGDSGGPWEYVGTAIGIHRGLLVGPTHQGACGYGGRIESDGVMTSVVFSWASATTPPGGPQILVS